HRIVGVGAAARYQYGRNAHHRLERPNRGQSRQHERVALPESSSRRRPAGRNPFAVTTFRQKAETTPCWTPAAACCSETFLDRRHKDSRTAWRGRLDRGESSPPRAMKE